MLSAAALALLQTGCGGADAAPSPTAIASPMDASDNAWRAIQSLYDVAPDMANLENGYWGAMPRPVLQEYIRQTESINRNNTIYARSQYDADAGAVRARVAQVVGAAEQEVALTRGATEALQKLIAGYNRLQAGDVVLYSDLDYDSMQYAMNWLRERRGAVVKTFAIPEPATHDAVLAAYREVLENTPRARLLLLTHLSHRTGLVMPVAEIAAMARAKGVDVIVDAAHSWGQIDFNVKDLGADFVGFNLHKWISAPVGVGFMYIARNRLDAIDPDLSDEDYPATDIRSRVHTGTSNFAAVLTVPTALDLHTRITARAKQARLTHLRNYWVDAVRNLPVQVLTPNDARMHAGITSFRFKGATSREANHAIVATLRDQYRVLTVRRAGIAKGQAIRVSPALYTREGDLDQLVAALKKMA